MRKTNLMLIAALVASPFALAGDLDSLDVDIDKSANFSLEKDITIEEYERVAVENVGNRDNDALVMWGVGNTYTKDIDIMTKQEETYEFDMDTEIDLYLAKSELEAGVMLNAVDYSAAGVDCCTSAVSTTIVSHENIMEGSFAGASGVSETAQNVGNNSMVQQASSTNAAHVSY